MRLGCAAHLVELAGLLLEGFKGSGVVCHDSECDGCVCADRGHGSGWQLYRLRAESRVNERSRDLCDGGWRRGFDSGSARGRRDWRFWFSQVGHEASPPHPLANVTTTATPGSMAPVITGRTRPTKPKKTMNAQKRKRSDVDVEQLEQAVAELVRLQRCSAFTLPVFADL